MTAIRLPAYAAHQAERRPEAVALDDGRERVTYGELEAGSNRLARALVEAGCRPGDRVALLLPKSAAAVTAMLATSKAGAVYVPLNLEEPATRTALILGIADCRLLLVDARGRTRLEELLPLLGEEGSPALGWVDDTAAPAPLRLRFSAADVAGAPDAPLACGEGPEAPVHILFTSGSTGAPKGVIVSHANVAAFVDWANAYFGLSTDERISCHSPLHFDLSTWDIYGGLAAGAEIHLVPPELNLFPGRLVEFIRERRLTQWFSVPSILAYLARFDAVPRGGLPELRRLIWCGEIFPTPALIQWMARLPHVRFTNLYGPTETTIASAYHTLDVLPSDPAADVPIGQACGGEEVLIVGEDVRPLPRGRTGEIAIAGAGVTLGYWRDEERTARAFVPDPGTPGRRLYRTGDLGYVDENGLIRFVGRRDSQVKVRGHRVELGEIEAALNEVPEVAQAVALAVRLPGWDSPEIGCAYAPRPNADLSTRQLRERLGRRLPRYMLPTRWICFERLPSNANGKIDRVALARMLEQ